MSTDKARFKGDTVAMKEIIGNKWDETEKQNLKEAKIINHHNLVNFKNACYQPLAIMFEYMYHLVFPRLEQFVKLVDWMGF